MKNKNDRPEYELPQSDFMFKRLFGYEGNEEITKDLISSIIGEPINTIEFKNPYVLRNISKDKEERLDIRAELDNKTICDIEIQVSNNHDIVKRILDYWAKLYTKEFNRGGKYKFLKRTIVILITNFKVDEFKELNEYRTTWEIQERKLKMRLTDMLELDIIELPKAREQIRKGTFKRTNQNDWIKFIINPAEMEVEEMEDLKEEIKKAYEIWQNTNLTDEEREIAEDRLLNLRSIEYGREYERDLGRKEGEKIGIEKTKIENAKKMLELGIEIDIIEKVTGLNRKKIEELK